MHDLICNAIAEHRVLALTYSQTDRTVEPHLLGYDSDGDLTLAAWQLTGTGEGWRDFHLAKVTGLAMTEVTFPGPRPTYNPGDKTIRQVVCRL